MESNSLKKFTLISLAYLTFVLILVLSANYFIDASSAIRPDHSEIAKLALEGNIVYLPDNYNDRVFQRNIVENMSTIPDTIVIGSSRGMYLGKEITGYESIYNNCVGGGNIEDYFAVLGLYENKFSKLPETIVIEISPWVFNKECDENRWMEDKEYCSAAKKFYKEVTGNELKNKKEANKENPYLSLSYFRYNITQVLKYGLNVHKNEVRISTNIDETADYPDGTYRYRYELENENEFRLSLVEGTSGPCTYQNLDKMNEVDQEKAKDIEMLIDYLKESNIKVILYLQPFSLTQVTYSIDMNMNPGIVQSYDYLNDFAKSKQIEIRGSYDPRDFNLGNERFIDFMHLDKIGTAITWNENIRAN